MSSIRGDAPSKTSQDGPAQPLKLVEPHSPVRLLCDEIGFRFDRRLERGDVLVAFVRELVSEVAQKRHVAEVTATMGGKGPSEASAEVLALTAAMLTASGREALIAGAETVHDACHRLNPDEAYPTDHLIDMLSSCASALRFGLEAPCRSRHAAEAASHVWKQVYGVSRFDDCTGEWENSWARQKLMLAIIGLLPPAAGQDPSERTLDGSSPQGNTP